MLTKRKTSTIPFGYKESNEKGFLEAIPEQLEELEQTKKHIINGSLSLRGAAEQLEELEQTKKHIINGSLSLRGAAEQLEHKTGRKISYVGLKKIVDKSRVKGLLDKREV